MKKTLLSLVAILALACYSNAQTNLLTNGTFDGIEGPLAGRTTNEWGIWSGNGSTATVIDGVVNIIPVASGDRWQFQLEQQLFVVENGKTYTVSFNAWADVDRVITISLEDLQNGNTRLGTTSDPGNEEGRSTWNVDTTTVQTKYQRTLVVDTIRANTVTKLVFMAAQTADMVYIDSVSLVEGTNVSVRDNKANALKLYPNPAVNDLYISGKSTLSKVEIYNVVGSRVREYRNVLQSINVSELKSGVYMIRLTDSHGQSFTSKFMKK